MKYYMTVKQEYSLKGEFTVLFQMGVERCIHRSPNVALKVHQIDALNFKI